MKVSDLFELYNGIATSSLIIEDKQKEGMIPFLRPSKTQQGTIAGWVYKSHIKEKDIYPSGSLFVSTNGEGSHSYSYVSSFEFAANSDITVLVPKIAMTITEKIFYAKCISLNRYKFSYGRKPKGDRLRNIELPDLVPDWVAKEIKKPQLDTNYSIRSLLNQYQKVKSDDKVSLEELFQIEYGTSLELNRLSFNQSGINFVARSSKNNGVTSRVDPIDGLPPIDGGCITVAVSGSVLETFYQPSPFYTGYHVMILVPKIEMSLDQIFYYISCIRANKYRYSYGRQANRTLRELKVPSLENIPNWSEGKFLQIINRYR